MTALYDELVRKHGIDLLRFLDLERRPEDALTREEEREWEEHLGIETDDEEEADG